MVPKRTSKISVSLVIALVVALTTVIGPSRHALAAGPRVLTLSDMGDFSGAEGANNNAIAGATYAKATLLGTNNAYVTLFTHHFPGYAAFTTAVGVEDGSADNHSGTATLVVTVDGKLVKTIAKVYGQAATTLTVPFGQASQIKLTLHMDPNPKKDLYMLLGNPTVLTSVPKSVAAPPAFGSGASGGNGGSGKTTLTLFSASVAAGSQETALITTGANAALTVVITYPGGTQQVLGPKKAGPDGHFAYSWVVPGGIAGVARVVVVSSGVAQATFTIQ
ncbi:MAG TPA: NPCBM/NEW2 domain-containing protein [Chloroflexota bacterium]|nr:NPCBM/NEW2 domain-containing protein [Chloroflexota bacterium]